MLLKKCFLIYKGGDILTLCGKVSLKQRIFMYSAFPYLRNVSDIEWKRFVLTQRFTGSEKNVLEMHGSRRKGKRMRFDTKQS